MSNGWTNIQTEIRTRLTTGAESRSAPPTASMLLLSRISPREKGAGLGVSPDPTGNAEFDQRSSRRAPRQRRVVLTPPVQQQIMARDDWFFWVERYFFGCICPGAFTSVDEVRERIDVVLGVIAAVPPPPPRSCRSLRRRPDRRINRLTSLRRRWACSSATPADRDQLADSDTPLAAFADVRSPQEAIARFRTSTSHARCS